MHAAHGKYFFSLLLFGSNGIVASAILLSSQEIVLLRTLLGSLCLLVLCGVTRTRAAFWTHKKDLFFLILSGAALGGGWIFLYEAYQLIGVSLASLAYYGGPVIVMLLSPLLFQEALTRPKVLGFLAVLVGVVLVSGQAFQQGKSLFGLFCGAMSALLYAAMVISNKKAQAITGLENAAIQLLAAFFVTALFVGLRQGFALSIRPGDWGPILFLGLVNTALGCYCYFSSIGRLPVQTVAICGYLEPLSAVLLSVALLHESLLPIQLLGAVLILGGAIFGECFHPRQRKLTKRPS